MSAVRARRHIESSSADDFLIALHLRGTAHGTQDGREVTLRPGDFALFDSTRPYSITFLGDRLFEHVIYQVPRASLRAHRQIGMTTALRVPAASSAGRLVSPYLQTLARPWPSEDGQPPEQSLVDAGLDLAASALRITGGLQGQPAPSRRALLGELKRYALAHLGDPCLSPEAAARASYISVREVHRQFARDGLSFGAWVREERLRRCRHDLTRPQLSGLAVSEIAARWGFRSPAHFTRIFTARYGMPPGQIRRSPRPDQLPGAADG